MATQAGLYLAWSKTPEDTFCRVVAHVVSLPLSCIINWATTWKNQQNACAPSEDSDQPGHQPSLIRVFAVCMKKAWILSYPSSAQRRLWSDWADAQADLSLRWAHMLLCWFCHEAAQFWHWQFQESLELRLASDKKRVRLFNDLVLLAFERPLVTGGPSTWSFRSRPNKLSMFLQVLLHRNWLAT